MALVNGHLICSCRQRLSTPGCSRSPHALRRFTAPRFFALLPAAASPSPMRFAAAPSLVLARSSRLPSLCSEAGRRAQTCGLPSSALFPPTACLHATRRTRGGGASVMGGEEAGPGMRGKGETVLLLDVMDTLVKDPFHVHIPRFFRMSMKELLAQKHPTAWVDFEKGLISEQQLQAIFFADGRDFDLPGLKEVMTEAYEWVEGMEDLLRELKEHKVEMHAFTNYPQWYSMIEEKLGLSRYLSWTFVSCHTGLRKPDACAYEQAAEQLGVEPRDCVFVDDRKSNVAAAVSAGMQGLHFTDAKQLTPELYSLFLIPH